MAKLGPNQITWWERSNRPGLLLPLAVCEEGERGKCISYWGTRGKRWGSGKRVGGWVMKGKEIGRLLGDKRGGGSICLH